MPRVTSDDDSGDEETAVPDSLENYLETVASFLDSVDWDVSNDAACLLSVREPHADCAYLKVAEGSGARRYLVPPFDAIVGGHLRVLWLLAERRFDDAFKAQTQVLQLFVKEVLQKAKDENWFLPICFRLCADLRLIAKAADLRPSRPRAAERASCHEQSAATIMECYRSCVVDARAPAEVTKRLAILNLTNQLFRIYFRINKLNLLKPLIRSIDNCGALYGQFSLQDRVTYKYFIGRKAMFDSELKIAEESLMFAFANCPRAYAKNKRLILMYLIPVKMFLGHMPTEGLLEKYSLTQFRAVAQAVREGNLLKLDEALEENEKFFIECGIFLMLEKLKIITYRTLFKKTCKILGTHQVPLDAFLVALKFMKVDEVDSDEVACIVANLIYQNKIKGYISHQHQKLVISKQNPFPALSSTAV